MGAATAAMAFGERRFGASYSARIMTGLVVLGVLAGIWASEPNPRPASHPTLVWVSVGILGALAAFWILFGKSTLTISDAGIRRESIFAQQEMVWSQITETRYRVTPVNVYAHFGLVGYILAMSSGKSGRAQLSLELLSGDGAKLKVTSIFRDAGEAIGLILARILPPLVQNVKARLQRGETVQFGGLGLSATTVTWKSQSIPVSQITKAELLRTNLIVKRQGKWLAAISVRSDKVPNVLAFLEVLESLAPQVKATGVDPLARVTM
jgi:uncharacterized membrane protein YeaQ/YmgE (transglycosylase-associated protein family)